MAISVGLSSQGAKSELMSLARSEYSNPPRFGASIVQTMLGDDPLECYDQDDETGASVEVERPCNSW